VHLQRCSRGVGKVTIFARRELWRKAREKCAKKHNVCLCRPKHGLVRMSLPWVIGVIYVTIDG